MITTEEEIVAGERLMFLIQEALTPDLLKPMYRKKARHPHAGHCYVASEALYHMWGKQQGFEPCVMHVNNGTHWFLKRGDQIMDPTKDQFNFELDYSKAKRQAFLTYLPSKRCKQLIERL